MRMRPNSLWSRAIVTLGLLWFVAVILAYYAVHKPLSGSQIDAIRDLVVTAVGWLSVFSLANLIGWGAIRRLSKLERGERLVLQVGFGLGIIAFAMLALGMVGASSQLLLWLLVLLPLPLSLYRLYNDGRDVRRPSTSALVIFVALALLVILIRALSPPTAWDSLVYHLTGPKLFQEAGRIHHDLDLAYLGFPKAGSMIYLLGLQLAGPGLAQLLHLTFFGMTLTLTPGLVRRAAPGRGWLAIAILVAVPSAGLLAGWAYVEWIAAFGALASYTLIRTWDSEKVDRVLILAAFFAALALNSKYTTIWLVFGLSLVVLLHGRSFRRWVAFLLATVVFIAPFLLSNLLLTGNPVYPFVFEGAFWDSHRVFWFSRVGTGLTLSELVAAPWDASIWGLEGGYYEGHVSYGATVGPLLLALIPLVMLRLILIRSARQGSIRDVVIIAAAAYLGWIAQLSFSTLLVQSRLLFPALPFFAALAVVGFDTVGQVGRWGVSVRFVLGGLVAFVLGLTATSMLFETMETDFLSVTIGAESEEAYLERRLGYHYLAMEEINRLDGRSRVRFLWEPRSYYCADPIVCEPDALLDRWWHDRQHFSTIEEIMIQWMEEGVTHVLYHRAGAEAVRVADFDPLEDGDWEALDRFLEQSMIPQRSFGDAYVLYELQP
jgi:hypothetical protein